MPGFINLDFADVTSVMKEAGYAHMGVGRAKGKDKAEAAALAAISSPLLETSIAGAKGVIISFVASEDLDIEEIERAAEIITENSHEDANITWGIAFDPNLDDELVITVIATGFDSASATSYEKAKTPFFRPEKPAEPAKPVVAETPAAPAAPAIPKFGGSAPEAPKAKAPEAPAETGPKNGEFYVNIEDLIKNN